MGSEAKLNMFLLENKSFFQRSDLFLDRYRIECLDFEILNGEILYIQTKILCSYQAATLLDHRNAVSSTQNIIGLYR